MSREEVTAALAAGRESLDSLLPVVYAELRELARRKLAREARRPLDTTSLVHEVYLRLVDESAVSARGRGYFFAAAAEAMRRILVEAARRRKRLRRGGGQDADPLDEATLAADGIASDVLALERALDGLARLFPRQAQVAVCRYYGGLSVEETAEALDVAARTVKRDWALARAWIARELEAAGG